MLTKFVLRSILVLCVMLLLSTAMVGSAASAQEITQDDPILAFPPEQTIQGGSPVPGGPGFISVSSFAFKAHSSSSDLFYNGTLLYNAGSTLGAYIAPVNFPHNATITKVVLFYKDSTALGDLILYVDQVNLFDGSTQAVATAFPNTSSGFGFIEATPSIPTVNNQLYSYIVVVDMPGGYGSNLGLVSVRIDYDYPVYLPTIQK